MLKFFVLMFLTIVLWCKPILAEQVTILNPSITCKALIESAFSDFLVSKNDSHYLLEFEPSSKKVVRKNNTLNLRYDYIVELHGLDSYMVLSKETGQALGLVSIPDYRLPCRAKWSFGNNLGKVGISQHKPDIGQAHQTPLFPAENLSEANINNQVPSIQKTPLS